uniref:Uncharacterized protein n=1 Tax=Glossina brevipalpis TaxID=37001 RepID=A0A1A9X3X7_9MUSC
MPPGLSDYYKTKVTNVCINACNCNKVKKSHAFKAVTVGWHLRRQTSSSTVMVTSVRLME